MSWVELPPGHDVVIKKGFTYSALARVKVNHSRADILARLKSYGLEVQGFDDPSKVDCGNTSSNYRCVGVLALATRDAGSVPWGSPLPLLDETSLVKAYYAGPGDLPQGKPSSTSSTMEWLLALAGAGGLGALWWWLRKHRKL